jgi:hypothetical protein
MLREYQPEWLVLAALVEQVVWVELAILLVVTVPTVFRVRAVLLTLAVSSVYTQLVLIHQFTGTLILQEKLGELAAVPEIQLV